jgi:hypothetical protein
LVGFHLGPLLKHFGEGTCWNINAETCRSYVERRTAGKLGRAVTESTARRELVTLSAAVSFAYKERNFRNRSMFPCPRNRSREGDGLGVARPPRCLLARSVSRQLHSISSHGRQLDGLGCFNPPTTLRASF